ncbi:MAG: hypothetical protein ACREWE_10370 [Gammaproteobacteria bacterium]
MEETTYWLELLVDVGIAAQTNSNPCEANATN